MLVITLYCLDLTIVNDWSVSQRSAVKLGYQPRGNSRFYTGTSSTRLQCHQLSAVDAITVATTIDCQLITIAFEFCVLGEISLHAMFQRSVQIG